MVSCRILCFALNCLFDFPRNIFCAVSILTRDRPVCDHSPLPFVIISNRTYFDEYQVIPTNCQIWGRVTVIVFCMPDVNFYCWWVDTPNHTVIFFFFQRQFCCYFIHLHARGNIGNSNRSRKYYWIICRKFQECVDRNGEQMEQICYSNKATLMEVWPCKWWTLWN